MFLIFDRSTSKSLDWIVKWKIWFGILCACVSRTSWNSWNTYSSWNTSRLYLTKLRDQPSLMHLVLVESENREIMGILSQLWKRYLQDWETGSGHSIYFHLSRLCIVSRSFTSNLNLLYTPHTNNQQRYLRQQHPEGPMAWYTLRPSQPPWPAGNSLWFLWDQTRQFRILSSESSTYRCRLPFHYQWRKQCHRAHSCGT